MTELQAELLNRMFHDEYAVPSPLFRAGMNHGDFSKAVAMMFLIGSASLKEWQELCDEMKEK